MKVGKTESKIITPFGWQVHYRGALSQVSWNIPLSRGFYLDRIFRSRPQSSGSNRQRLENDASSVLIHHLLSTK